MLKFSIAQKDVTNDANLNSVTTRLGLNRSTTSFGLETSAVNIFLKNAAAKLIKDTFNNCDFPQAVLPSTLTTDCGDFKFNIKASDVEWCNDCTANVSLSSDQDEELCFNRLKNTKVLGPGDDFWDHIIANNKYCKVPYSIDTTVFNMIVIQGLNIIQALPNLILKLIKPVALQRQQWWLYGTGRYHIGIKLSDIFEFHANKCGRTFKSSIFNAEPWSRLHIIPAASDQGPWLDEPDINIEFTDRYLIDMSMTEFFTEMSKLVNAEWRITLDEIIIEPEEFFINDAINLGQLNANAKVCLQPYVKNCKQYQFIYREDFVDEAGDSERSLYLETIDVSNESRSLTETCKTSLPFSIASNSRGRHARSIISDIRGPNNNDLGDARLFMGRELILSRHRSAAPKLFFKDTADQFPGFCTMEAIQFTKDEETFSLPNPQLSFNQDVPGNLFDSIHYKQLPEAGFLPCLESVQISVCYSCDLVQAMRTAFAEGKTVYFESEDGNLYFTEADVTFGTNRNIIIKNVKTYQ